MKYKAVIETDEYKDFEFFEDANGKYIVGAVNNGWILLYFSECEQASNLDKIRAEIEEQVLESLSDGGDDWFAAEKVSECLDIIDKYKESEQ